MADGNTGFLTDMDIRLWLNDTDPALNELIDNLEFNPEQIRTAQTLVVDKWNETPPDVGVFNLYDFPWRFHLLLGTAAQLLYIAANLYRRNKLEYKIPGGGVNTNARDGDYTAAADRLWGEYTSWMKLRKSARSIDGAWGTT